LDFYKNNTIHFFLLAALLSRALLAGQSGAALKDEVGWWLDFYRWEFPLPEREAMAAALGDLLAFYRREGALTGGDKVDPRHPLIRTTAGLLDNFGEAYWIMARTVMQSTDGGMARKALIDAARKRYQTGLLLGEVRQPEGNSTVTLDNAVSRYAELGFLTVNSGVRSKERMVHRGPRFAELERTAQHLAASLAVLRSRSPQPNGAPLF